jgi:geranylgeranyl diphosphate synthase type I
MKKSENLRNEMLAALENELRASAEIVQEGSAPDMFELISYHMGWSENQAASGKRIRPLLTLLCCTAARGDWHTALPAAAAIEWLHNFSLIHDDIEDKSRTRRGRETLWAKIGIPLALNTGDAVFALMRLSTSRLHETGVGVSKMLELHALIDRTALRLCEGQHLDIRFETDSAITSSEYLTMASGKTSALIACACLAGATLSPASEEQRQHYGEFGRNLGLAFQMQDDILGVWGMPERTGKPSGDDLLLRKKTLPVLYGLQRSPRFHKLWQQAPDESQISKLTAALDEHGIREEVQAKADEYSNAALQSLQVTAPEQPAGGMLTELLESLLRRDH